MKNRQLQRLGALERLRKLKEDRERMHLAEALRNKQKADDACEAGERKFEELGDRSNGLTSAGLLIDMAKFVFLGERLSAESEAQIELVESKESSESHLRTSVTRTADAWKRHAAVTRKRDRTQREMSREQEAKTMEEDMGLWLARRGGQGS